MEANTSLLERPPLPPEVESVYNTYAQLGELAVAISDEFARPAIEEGVLIVENYTTEPVRQRPSGFAAMARTDYQPSILRYYNLRTKDNTWKFDFMFEANPDKQTAGISGGTPGSHSGREGDRPWVDDESIREITPETAEKLLWGLNMMQQDLIEYHLLD